MLIELNGVVNRIPMCFPEDTESMTEIKSDRLITCLESALHIRVGAVYLDFLDSTLLVSSESTDALLQVEIEAHDFNE